MPDQDFRDPTNLDDRRVALASLPAYYDDEAAIGHALGQLCTALGWGDSERPFSRLVRRNDRVLVKPNWVLHQNQGKSGFECLVTHGAVLRNIVRGLSQTDASRITVGDAPVQGCNFDAMIQASNLDRWLPAAAASDARIIGPVDFRRTVSSVASGVRETSEGVRDLDQYVLFDLGPASYLEPVTRRDGAFRVTMYPPGLMAKTHARGRHQYLVAREVMDADVIINAPKLKTHKKAGVTCALKNLVGINGNKEYLPHHRIGSVASGGDCYPEESVVKTLLERVLDVKNTVRAVQPQRALGFVARALQSIAHRQGDELGVEGAWSGNDTVWRMCLDLNRIVLYGKADGSIATTPQRRVVNVVDAIIAGQGDGPLAPDPLPMGHLYASASSAAADWVGSELLGYMPSKIPITAESFKSTPWPLVRFAPAQIQRISMTSPPATSTEAYDSPINYPAGWRDAVAVR